MAEDIVAVPGESQLPCRFLSTPEIKSDWNYEVQNNTPPIKRKKSWRREGSFEFNPPATPTFQAPMLQDRPSSARYAVQACFVPDGITLFESSRVAYIDLHVHSLLYAMHKYSCKSKAVLLAYVLCSLQIQLWLPGGNRHPKQQTASVIKRCFWVL